MKACPNCGEQIQDAARKCRFCGEMTDQIPRPEKRSSAPMIVICIVVGLAVMFLALPVLGIVVALVLPAVQQAREAARRSECKNNLKNIALALHNYHDRHGSLPPAYFADENGRPQHSWRVMILPQLGEQALYDQYDFAQPWDSPANQQVLNNMPKVYACPSGGGGNSTNYAGVFGPDCVFTGTEPVRFRDVADGLSSTLMVGEVDGANIPWTKPEDVDITLHPTLAGPAGFHSGHSGGVQFALGDGSVRFVSENINQQTLQQLFTRSDGGPIGDF